MSIFYIKTKFINKTRIHSRPEEDLGFNHNIHEDFVNEQGGYVEGILVKIDDVIEELNILKKEGVNYVNIDPDEDHEELNIRGFEIRLMNDEEIAERELTITKKKSELIQEKIKRLERELENLKSEE
jgi:predicted TIM-barrel fold metal-dependent hydrolase